MSHFLDDSPTTGLAACQVPRGLLGSFSVSRIGRAGPVNSEDPLKARSLPDWVPSGQWRERLWVTLTLSKLGVLRRGTLASQLPLNSEFLFLLLDHRVGFLLPHPSEPSSSLGNRPQNVLFFMLGPGGNSVLKVQYQYVCLCVNSPSASYLEPRLIKQAWLGSQQAPGIQHYDHKCVSPHPASLTQIIY